MVTVLFRDEIDNANLDVAIGTLDIPNGAEVEKFIGSELPFTVSEPKVNIFPYRSGDIGIVELKKNKRFKFQIIRSTTQNPYQGSLILLNRAAPRNTIYTIGYGNREIDEFIVLLKQYEVQFLIDIRSSAYSKYNEAFSQTPLQEKLSENSIKYVFMGEQLGGKPDDNSCYTDGKVDYEKVENRGFYQEGIERLETALQKQLRVVLMCSELRPEQCHRSKLIAQTLNKKGIEVAHIDEKGIVRNQLDVISRLNKGQLSMFEQTFTSRKAYR